MMNGVLITGASSGIGMQLAKDYASSGVPVIACGRNQEALDLLAAEYQNVHILTFDVTDAPAVTQAFTQLPFVPTLWILNAGHCEYINDGKLDALLIRRVFETNFMGMVHCLEAMQSQLSASHHVVILGSISSDVPLPRAEAYGASKAALKYLAQSLALDWAARQIVVSTVFPGFVHTPLTAKNTFSMPMAISVTSASKRIRDGIAQQKSCIYLPFRFTLLLRVIGLLPFALQRKLLGQLVRS
jgi:short-subunit dehydrogenase